MNVSAIMIGEGKSSKSRVGINRGVSILDFILRIVAINSWLKCKLRRIHDLSIFLGTFFKEKKNEIIDYFYVMG